MANDLVTNARNLEVVSPDDVPSVRKVRGGAAAPRPVVLDDSATMSRLFKDCFEIRYDIVLEKTEIRALVANPIVPSVWTHYRKRHHALAIGQMLRDYANQTQGGNFKEPTLDRTHQIIEMLGGQAEHRYDAALSYLESVRNSWDGIPRVGKFFETYCDVRPCHDGMGLTSEDLTRISYSFITAIVARRWWPGVLYPHTIVFEGLAGAGKSGPFKRLCEDGFSSHSRRFAARSMEEFHRSGAWVIELAEMASFKTENAHNIFKDAVSETFVEYTAKYESEVQRRGKRFLFICSTNEREYLPHGEDTQRRIIPLLVGSWDEKPDVKSVAQRMDAIGRDRDQIFAEAQELWAWACAMEGVEPFDTKRALTTDVVLDRTNLYTRWLDPRVSGKLGDLSAARTMDEDGAEEADAIVAACPDVMRTSGVTLGMTQMRAGAAPSAKVLSDALRRGGYAVYRCRRGKYWSRVGKVTGVGGVNTSLWEGMENSTAKAIRRRYGVGVSEEKW